MGSVERMAFLLDPWVAFTLGIPMTFGLLAGPFSDQMFFQRALAIERKYIVRSFVYAGLLFAAVPITLSLLGFMGAGMVRQGLLEVSDPQLVGPAVVAALLPKAALYAFCFMAFAGLCSTMDSSLCALSSLGGIDIFRRYVSPRATEGEVLRFSRLLHDRNSNRRYGYRLTSAQAAVGVSDLWSFGISRALPDYVCNWERALDLTGSYLGCRGFFPDLLELPFRYMPMCRRTRSWLLLQLCYQFS